MKRFLLVVLLGVVGYVATSWLAVQAAPFHQPVCEHEVIAQYRHVEKSSWIEIVDVAESIGQITKEHAQSLRAIIEEAYLIDRNDRTGLTEWVVRNCGVKSET